jgi:acyl carrier protein
MNIGSRVTKLIVEILDYAETHITPGANLIEDLGADSLESLN